MSYEQNFFYDVSFIKKIFELDEDKKNFKNKAKKYQYILKFFLTDENASFKITAIQNKVLKEAPDIFKVDKTQNPSIINKNKNKTFNSYLEDLESWNLVLSRPAKNIKGGVETKEYHLSKLGKTFALITECILCEHNQNNHDRLFDDWKSYLTDFSTSLDLFCLKYLDKCKQSGLFNEFANYFVKNQMYQNLYIRNNADLFSQMILVKSDDTQKNQILSELWAKSYYELDEKSRQLFSNHMRIQLNRMIAMNVNNYTQYESQRYDKLNLSGNVIVEFICSCCKSNFKYVSIRVISYISYAFIKEDAAIEHNLKNLKCEKCNENKFHLNMVI
jgi:hypothetical protein